MRQHDAPHIDPAEVRAHIAKIEEREAELRKEKLMWQNVLRAVDPGSTIVPKNRIIGHIKKFLYTAPSGATDGEVMKYLANLGVIGLDEMHRLRQSLSRCVTAGTLVMKGDKYILAPAERSRMAADPRAYKLDPETAKKYARKGD